MNTIKSFLLHRLHSLEADLHATYAGLRKLMQQLCTIQSGKPWKILVFVAVACNKCRAIMCNKLVVRKDLILGVQLTLQQIYVVGAPLYDSLGRLLNNVFET